MDILSESLKLHEKLKGKIEISPRVSVSNSYELSLAYTPGVAEPCLEIQKNIELSYVYTRRHNLVAVITDGTAILGLGDIGPEAGMPVMEGKCVLFKTFGEVDAFPLCLKTKDPDEIVRTISLLSGSFGGINLEDISAPRCFEIEKKLKAILDIPVFHDDQHGTAIVVCAALINALSLANKKMPSVKIVINGAGAAGISIADYLLHYGIKDIILCDKFGIIDENDLTLSPIHREIAKRTNKNHLTGTLENALKGADVFIGVSGPNCVTKTMIKSMNPFSIVFPLANPVSEISYEDAKEAGAYIVGTGSSKYPNQINNVLVFPGIFRGALDERASDINLEMMKAASYAIASLVTKDLLAPNFIIPFAFDPKVHKAVAKAVASAAVTSKVSRIHP
ncbi:MAG: NADP-dependent malic enzyme [Firmicutes bacterium]|nr:NADP-dependent malic enzyme [Bacillota bacterium]